MLVRKPKGKRLLGKWEDDGDIQTQVLNLNEQEQSLVLLKYQMHLEPLYRAEDCTVFSTVSRLSSS
jgi:hypothetical protein